MNIDLNAKTIYTSHLIIDEDPENCGIEIVEEYPCNNLSELKVREVYWKSKLDCVNKHTPNALTVESCGSLDE